MPDYRPSPDQLNSMMTEPLPESPIEANMTPIELEGLAAAEAADEGRENVFESMAPDGAYSVDALNDLVESLNKALPLFDVKEQYPSFDGPVDGPLPTDFVAKLSMVSQAAKDAGIERLSPDLNTMNDDSGLDKAARQIDTLVDNQSFVTFLKTEQMTIGRGKEQSDLDAGPPPSAAPALQEPSEDEVDDMFAGRM